MIRGRPGAALLALAALLAPGAARGSAVSDHAGPRHVYVVMPFENIAEDRSLDWLASGLALSLGEALQGLGVQIVDDEERTVLLEANGIPDRASITLASAVELGRRMRARSGAAHPDRMVLGRFNVAEGILTLSARSIEIAEEKARPWVSRQGRLKDLLAVQEGLTIALARGDALPVEKLSPDGAARSGADPPLLAYEHYCRGMAETDSKKRLQLLRRAVQEYPGFAKAAYQAASVLAKAERWNEAAEMLGRTGGEPHPYESGYYLLTAAVDLERRDSGEAAGAARRALAYADSARGHALLGRGLLAQGDPEAARAELQKAEALDPSEPENDELRRALAEQPQPARRTP